MDVEDGSAPTNSASAASSDDGGVLSAEGTVRWFDPAGALHRDFDLPAVIFPDGGQEWFQHGVRHREDNRPAVVRSCGAQQWWVRGVPQYVEGALEENDIALVMQHARCSRDLAEAALRSNGNDLVYAIMDLTM